MKFAVGYQLADEDERAFSDIITPYREHLAEVYFPWLDTASGRSPIATRRGYTDWTAQARMEDDLRKIKAMGLRLDLLFNANCYGRLAISEELRARVGSILEHLEEAVGGVDVVTTTSPFIAQVVKDYFPGIEVRASVNMCIGTEEGFDYVKDYFDSFYLKRELNRDLGTIRQLKSWCDDHGKVLYGLANSGCLNNCSAHTFHDNLVSHEQEISKMDNGYAFEGVCRAFLKDPANHYKIVDRTGFIRPEDVDLYEDLFPALKLATRVSPNPLRILRAYTARHYRGNMLELLEPNHSGIFYPHVLENSRIISQVEDEKLLYTGLEDAIIQLEESLC